MHLSRLRLVGFKSFVEPTELVISRGLTGVVGPNGCGKSNLLEALRWVMGESSYKSMRGSAMDDVIFSGTATRPARNTAEVTLFIDNAERLAPAEYNDAEQIEISRRIEREAGSAYRINGREARARDVKVLFEDAATGARSPALVRQGQIAEIINAKPEARRRILEDAAGVAGLHSRRHEAELRLKAAEANLARLDDVVGGLNAQVESLKRQARQARRYREISGEIHRVEALTLYLAWRAAADAAGHEEAGLHRLMEELAAATAAEAQALRNEGEQAEALPALRDALARSAAASARIRHELESFEKEAEQRRRRRQELEGQAEGLSHDRQREAALAAEAAENLQRLEAELEGCRAEEQGFAAAETEAQAEHGAAEEERRKRDGELNEATSLLANETARRGGLQRTQEERGRAVERLVNQLAALATEHDRLNSDAGLIDESATLEARCHDLEAAITEADETAMAAEARVGAVQRSVEAARAAAEEMRLKAASLKVERETLTRLLRPEGNADYPALIDALKVAPGYETALGAALGDDLDAPADERAALHWRLLPSAGDDGELPDGAVSLAEFVRAPPELQRRLAQTGFVARPKGHKLQPLLKPGQRLVSREGDLWRWDGFVAASEGVSAAAQRLEQRNRLTAIAQEETELGDELEARNQELAAERQSLGEAQDQERKARASWREAQGLLSAARQNLQSVARRISERDAKLAAISGAKERASGELDEARRMLAQSEAEVADFGDERLSDLAERRKAAEDAAGVARTAAATAKAALDSLRMKRSERLSRQTALRADCQRWRERGQSAGSQIASLVRRISENAAELEALQDVPGDLEARRQALLDTATKAEAEEKAASDLLQRAETEARSAVEALRAAQAALGSLREQRAGIDARMEAQRQRRDSEARRIAEIFDCEPDACLEVAGMPEGADLPAFEDVERRLQKLKSDRERLGGVNLQADDDLQRISAQVEQMETERADVQQAVDKLRHGIGQLNREGRRRINEAFEIVNGHFGRLFETLFGGGEARLEMVQSQEDPLEGGLEIMAKPPGKKPATLSLLSGGEQTLTALALIFAVFLTNPSPICVLDEVDAPLDDANVDRFCTLMERMAEETATRFLVITHHPMTMTRMDRLFGVTMAERGISQLVSVDLETAQGFREVG